MQGRAAASARRPPAWAKVRGQYVLQVPGTSFVIDGACENSPFECGPASPAIFANHSATPNARIESWPVLRPGPLEVRQHMMLVATEPIGAGHGIRINYEADEASYWEALGHAADTGIVAIVAAFEAALEAFREFVGAPALLLLEEFRIAFSFRPALLAIGSVFTIRTSTVPT